MVMIYCDGSFIKQSYTNWKMACLKSTIHILDDTFEIPVKACYTEMEMSSF